MSSLSRESILTAVEAHSHWYHQIELPGGIVTPGTHDSRTALSHLDSIGLPVDCRGMRVLDIGCRDGFFSFEMERRGGIVVGIDYALATSTGFSTVKDILGSEVEYLVQNVYDLAPDRNGMFDVVLFLGVIYHLRNPLLSLDLIRSVTRPGGSLYVESHVLDNYVLRRDGTITSLASEAPGLLELPLMQFYPADTLASDCTNKWAPNMSCLAHMVEEAQFRVERTLIYHSRGYVSATAVHDDRLEASRRMDAGKGYEL